MYDFIQREEAERMIQSAVEPLLRKVLQLEAQTDEYLSTEQARKILGCSRAFLEKERTRPGTLLKVSYNNTKPTYSRASLYAYKEARAATPHQSR